MSTAFLRAGTDVKTEIAKNGYARYLLLSLRWEMYYLQPPFIICMEASVDAPLVA